MEATEKIISIMTRWRRSDAACGDQIASGDSQECRTSSVEGTHPLPVVQPEAIVEAQLSLQSRGIWRLESDSSRGWAMEVAQLERKETR